MLAAVFFFSFSTQPFTLMTSSSPRVLVFTKSYFLDTMHRINVILLLVQGAEGVSRGVLKWSSSHTHTTDPSSSAMLLAGQGKHSCCLEDIL